MYKPPPPAEGRSSHQRSCYNKNQKPAKTISFSKRNFLIPSSMAFNFRSLLLLLLTAIIFFPTGVVSLTAREYDSMQRVLRSHGYNLVCNAMATSDLQWLLLTFPANASFTIFAPTDAALFALDMTQTASSYTDTLRLHVVPLRLSLSNLRSLASDSVLPTLLPSSALRLVSTRPLSVSGVDVVLPGLYYSRHVAVHGLGDIVGLASLVPYGFPPPVHPMITTTASDLDRTVISPEIAPSSSEETSSPSPSPSREHEISPAFFSENRISAASPAPLSADLVAERARALLEETSTVPDHEILGGESEPFMMEVDNKLEKCGALDEMAIDCFVPEGASTGVDQRSVHRVVRVLT